MTDNDLLADGENPVADAGGGMLVVRISRTAGGTRTWTVGATAPLADTGRNDDARLIRRLLAVDKALATASANGDGADVAVTDGDTTLTEQLRRSLIMSVLRKAYADTPAETMDYWVPGPTIVTAIGGSRARTVADLQALVRAGVIEYAAGGGRGKPSRYRLIVAGVPALRAVKGSKA